MPRIRRPVSEASGVDVLLDFANGCRAPLEVSEKQEDELLILARRFLLAMLRLLRF